MSTELNPFGPVQPSIILVTDNPHDARQRFGLLTDSPRVWVLCQGLYEQPVLMEQFRNVTILLPHDLVVRPHVARDLRRLIYDPSNKIIKV